MFAGKPSDEIPLRLWLLYVSDLDRSISFYQEVVGLRLASRDTIARFDIDGAMFECVPAPSQARSKRTGECVSLRYQGWRNGRRFSVSRSCSATPGRQGPWPEAAEGVAL